MVRTGSTAKPTTAPPGQRGWVLLVGISIASTLGLAAALLPLLQQRLDSPWPWADTQRVLLFAFPITVIAATLYLSDQQRRAHAVHHELLREREAVAERAQRHAARLSALLNVGRIMGAEINLQNVFDAVTQMCREAFGCDRVSLMLVDREAQELVVRSTSGHDSADDVVGTRQKIGEGVAGHVAANGKPVVLGPGAPDAQTFQGLRAPKRPLGAAVVVPVVVRGELVGVLNVASHQGGASFDAEDLQALQVFAENVGSCIRHAEQAEWMRQLIQRHTAAASDESRHPTPSSR